MSQANTEAVRELVRSSEYLMQKVERIAMQASALSHATVMLVGSLADLKEATRAVKAALATAAEHNPSADAATIAAAISENEQPAESGRSLIQ